LQQKQVVVAPGVFELISAKVADRMGFRALYATGYGITASHLGLADAGLATYSDMVERVGQIARSCRTPLIADADTGYGGLWNLRHTVRGYEAAGVAAIQIEDQEIPKKCGHTPGRRVISAKEMALKVELAVDARKSSDFLVIARTDARTSLGLEEAIDEGSSMPKLGLISYSLRVPRVKKNWRALAARLVPHLSLTWSRAAARQFYLPSVFRLSVML
jgi:2,3-dimethylmalate lyase